MSLDTAQCRGQLRYNAPAEPEELVFESVLGFYNFFAALPQF